MAQALRKVETSGDLLAQIAKLGVDATRPVTSKAKTGNPVEDRRAGFIKGLDDQLADVAFASEKGEAAEHMKSVTAQRGSKKGTSKSVKIRRWWWVSNGTYTTGLKYGVRPVKIAGKEAFAVGKKLPDLTSFYSTVKLATQAGKLDEQLAALGKMGRGAKAS